jgi:hypothetical protein
VSYGVGCGELGYPGAYTRTSCYLQWIAEQFGMTGTSSSSSGSSSWSTPCPVSDSSVNNLNTDVISPVSTDSNSNNDVITSNDYDVVDASSFSRLFENDDTNILSRELPSEAAASKAPEVENKKPSFTALHWPFYHYIQPTYYVQPVNRYLFPANVYQHFQYPYFYH